MLRRKLKESAKQEAAKAALEAAKLLAESSGFTISDFSEEAQEAILPRAQA